MKTRYIVIGAVVALVLVLSVSLAWGAGGTKMHQNMPANMQNMSTEEMQEFCQEMHAEMGSEMMGSEMMGGSGNGGSMMDGGSMMGGGSQEMHDQMGGGSMGRGTR